MDTWYHITSFSFEHETIRLLCSEIYQIQQQIIRQKLDFKYSEWNHPLYKYEKYKYSKYKTLHFLLQLMAYNGDWDCISYTLDHRKDPELVIHTVLILHSYGKIDSAAALFKRNKRILFSRNGNKKENLAGFIPQYPAVYSFYAEMCNIKYIDPSTEGWSSEIALGFVTPNNESNYKYRNGFFVNPSKIDSIYTRKTYYQHMLDLGLPHSEYSIDTYMFYTVNTNYMQPIVVTKQMAEQMSKFCQKYDAQIPYWASPIYLYACKDHWKGDFLSMIGKINEFGDPNLTPSQEFAIKQIM